MTPDSTYTSETPAAVFDDRAWLDAMLQVEGALAHAEARAGLLTHEEAMAIGAACATGSFDSAEIGQEAAATGNPVLPLVRRLVEALEGPAAGKVHLGATSQDIVDSAAMLMARTTLDLLLAELDLAIASTAALAESNRATPMAGRTLLQQATPTSFGLKAAGWMVGLADARSRLAELRATRLAVQLGGAVGTLAALHPKGLEVLRHLADLLGLAEPVLPWHTDRTRIGELAGALGVTAGVLAKIARDVVLLAQTEVGEVSEGGGGRGEGGSSSMPHKRNPVRAVGALAAARQAPGLVATLLSVMDQEHERAAGGWQAEWRPLGDLFRVVGDAAGQIRILLEGLVVHRERMLANLDLTGGLVMAERLAGRLCPEIGNLAAHERVAAVVRRAVEEGRGLRAVLEEDVEMMRMLGPGELDVILEPGGYLGSASELVYRALRGGG